MPNESGETKTVILLRHGQSEFNVHITATRRDPGIADPCLTEHGHTQAEQAARALKGERVARIVVSPYSRALQTAEPVARVLDVPMFVHPVVRERYGYACDIGTPPVGAAGTLARPRFLQHRRSLVAVPRRTRGVRHRPGAGIPNGDGGAAGLVGHPGRQPLGLHSVHDRAERHERPMATLRPHGTTASRNNLAVVGTRIAPARGPC